MGERSIEVFFRAISSDLYHLYFQGRITWKTLLTQMHDQSIKVRPRLLRYYSLLHLYVIENVLDHPNLDNMELA